MKINTSQFVGNILIMLYFLILFGERMQSLLRSALDKNVKLFDTGFNIYVNVLTIISLVGFAILFASCNLNFIKSLFTRDLVVYEGINWRNLCITSGVLLLSGMVHTEYTIPPIQFAAYGVVIASMIIKTANNNAGSGNSLLLWLSMIYLIMFSMAVPVMYHSDIEKATLFHIVEAITAAILVFAFSFMMYKVYTNQAVNLFYIWPILIALIGDAIILIMRWKEKVNGFVLIFLIVSAVMWLTGKIVSLVSNTKLQ